MTLLTIWMLAAATAPPEPFLDGVEFHSGGDEWISQIDGTLDLTTLKWTDSTESYLRAPYRGTSRVHM